MPLTKLQRRIGIGFLVALAIAAFFVVPNLFKSHPCNTTDSGCGGAGPGPGPSAPAQPGSDLPAPGSAEYNSFVTTVDDEAVYIGDINPNGDGAIVTDWLNKAEQACALLGASGPDVAASVLRNQGYDATGAEAIVAAAARVLCTDTGYAGWYTQFDKELGTAIANIGSYYSVTIGSNQIRALAQTACRYFGANQGDLLYNYLSTHALMPEPDASQRQIVYRGDVNNEKRVVNMVTVQVCPDLSEPPFWTTYN